MAEKVIVQIKILDDGKAKVQFDTDLPALAIVNHLAKAIQALCADSLVPLNGPQVAKSNILVPNSKIVIPK